MATGQQGELRGKVALITGGTSGIGRDAAVLFAKEGAKVAVTGRRGAEGQETVALARAAGGEATFIQGDVSKSSEVRGMVKKVVDTYGRLDVAFNNAGVEGKWMPIIDLPEDSLTK